MNKAERAKRRELILLYASILIGIVALVVASAALIEPHTVYIQTT